MSDTQQTIKTLRRYNQWRRGNESIGQPDPTEIGVAIDNAINLIKQRDMLVEAMTEYMDHLMRYGFVTAVENHKVEQALAAVKGGDK
jgi:hypothetical protein